MSYQNFEELIQRVRETSTVRRAAVVAAQDAHTLEAVLKVQKEGIVQPLLIGDRAQIEKLLIELNGQVPSENIYNVHDVNEAAALAVQLVHQGKADFLVKGRMETAELLRAVIHKDTGLSKGGVMSHIAINEVPAYHKLLVTTDGGMFPYPNLDQKKAILENAVSALRAMGYPCPKVAVLAAVEKVNPKMPESVDAEALKGMNLRGEITGCVVEGPISLDLAICRERSVTKGYVSDVAGDADILLVPNITSGNILGKSLVEMAGAKMAGLILGAQVPVVVTSRGSSSEEKYLAMVLAAAMS